jgi:hypothetical protein
VQAKGASVAALFTQPVMRNLRSSLQRLAKKLVKAPSVIFAVSRLAVPALE